MQCWWSPSGRGNRKGAARPFQAPPTPPASAVESDWLHPHKGGAEASSPNLTANRRGSPWVRHPPKTHRRQRSGHTVLIKVKIKKKKPTQLSTLSHTHDTAPQRESCTHHTPLHHSKVHPPHAAGWRSVFLLYRVLYGFVFHNFFCVNTRVISGLH